MIAIKIKYVNQIIKSNIHFFQKKLPDIDVDALIMERILNSSAYHIVYQGLNANQESICLLLDSFWIKLISIR